MLLGGRRGLWVYGWLRLGFGMLRVRWASGGFYIAGIARFVHRVFHGLEAIGFAISGPEVNRIIAFLEFAFKISAVWLWCLLEL